MVHFTDVSSLLFTLHASLGSVQVFAKTELSYAFVNLKPVVPGMPQFWTAAS
jgi:hypothetical protein